jgi:hypothetical protein
MVMKTAIVEEMDRMDERGQEGSERVGLGKRRGTGDYL